MYKGKIPVLGWSVNLSYQYKYGTAWVTPNEIRMLRKYSKDKSYLEIGSFEGFSACNVVDIVSEITCVDITLYPKMQLVLNDFPKIQFLEKSSEESACLFDDEELDVVFIDANHGYPSVKRDIELYKSKVNSDGVLIFHDYGTVDEWPKGNVYNVAQAVDELMPQWECIDYVDSLVVMRRVKEDLFYKEWLKS